MTQPTQTNLVRGIRRWDLVALAVNNIVGAGILGLPSEVYKQAGTYSLFAFLACALVVSCIALCYAELSSRFTETGGPYLFAHRAFGPHVGFVVGWLNWLSRMAGFAAVCNLFVGYLGYFWPAVQSGPRRWAVITAVVVALTVVNLRGVRGSALFSNVFTVGKVIPLVVFTVVGLFFIDPGRYSLAAVPSRESFTSATLVLMFAFQGYGAAVVMAGEIEDPRRNTPFAIITSLAGVTVLYVLIQVVCIGTLPGLATSERPLADAAGRFLGPAGGVFVSAFALVSVVGTLHMILLVVPRVLFAVAEQGQLPPILAATHPRHHTPHVAILVSAAVMLVVTLTSTFIYAAMLSAMARLLTTSTTCAGLAVLRLRDQPPPARFVVPGGMFVSAAGIGLCVWLASSLTWGQVRAVVIAVGVGLIFHFAHRLSRRVPPTEEAVDSTGD